MSKTTENPPKKELKNFHFAYYPEFICQAESQEEANKLFSQYVENLTKK